MDTRDAQIKTPAQLGLALRERRMQLGKDQFSIAEKAGISRAWLVALEKGKSGVSVGVVLRVLSALGLQMSISDEEVKQLRLSVPSKMKRVDLNALLGAWKKKHDQ